MGVTNAKDNAKGGMPGKVNSGRETEGKRFPLPPSGGGISTPSVAADLADNWWWLYLAWWLHIYVEASPLPLVGTFDSAGIGFDYLGQWSPLQPREDIGVFRLRAGIELPGDRALLEAHHGSMVPKAADKNNPKAAGKGKSKGGDTPQTSKIDFALPTAMVTCLQAITSRSTQDLWTSPTAVPTDLSVEQQAQRRASAVGKLSKRINGDLRAKEELRTALQTWMSTIGLHLAGLAQRVRALGDKVDVDLAEACREMQAALAVQPSLATSEQVATAIDAIGKPIWSLPQEQETLRLAASLRAFSVVELPARGPDGMSEVSFGTAGIVPFGTADSAMNGAGAAAMIFDGGESGRLLHTGDASSGHARVPPSTAPDRDAHAGVPEGVASRAKRWRRRDGAEASRPSKSPRREVLAGAPWPASATGTTPDALQRQPRTQLLEVEESVHSTEDSGLTWESAWQQVLQFALEHGTAMVGEVIRDSQQDAVLPLQDDSPEDRADLLAAAEELWMVLQAAAGLADAAAVPSLCVRLQELLNRVRQCPSALSGIRQGTLLMAQITVGNLLDPYSYAPTTAQEWLFPAAIAEHGALARGHIATMPSASQAMTALLAKRCPALLRIPDDGVPDLL
ncbi:unnamed protein product [Symbiodinium necroappetens]|uniref:Uncharacterized protein n=1 Tax=Symbiodinium necroappetens TaxID=1628268 RepID=A0A812PYX3_9DINO|nr:unnamed protein product [Symbiodinium necroappetens]